MCAGVGGGGGGWSAVRTCALLRMLSMEFPTFCIFVDKALYWKYVFVINSLFLLLHIRSNIVCVNVCWEMGGVG